MRHIYLLHNYNKNDKFSKVIITDIEAKDKTPLKSPRLCTKRLLRLRQNTGRMVSREKALNPEVIALLNFNIRCFI